MILLVDNYDSFVYNLRRYLQRLGQEVVVVRNDAVDFDRLAAGEFHAVVLSPGPKSPTEAGCCVELVRRFSSTVPILGVCLGHQAICQAFGGKIVRAPLPMHGRTSPIDHDGSRLFAGLPSPFPAARYHSLVADKSTLPRELTVTAVTPPDLVMAVEAVGLRTFGVQFHPESILTSGGYRILANFLQGAGLAAPLNLPDSDLASDENLANRYRTEEYGGLNDPSLDEQFVPAVLPAATGPRI